MITITEKTLLLNNLYSSTKRNGRRFASDFLPVLVIALKRNGAYAGNI